MRARAQLARPVPADRDHPHLVAVLLAEQRHRAEFARLRQRHHRVGDVEVLADLLVHAALDFGQGPGGQRRAVPEVEPDAVWRVLRARLRGLRPDGLVESLVDHVRGGVGAADRATARRVDGGEPRLADRDRSVHQAAAVHGHALDRRLDVVHLDAAAAVQQDRAVVGELTAGLGVERRAVEDDLDVRGRVGRGCGDAVHQQPQHVASR